MAKSTAGSHSKAAVAGMVLIRVFLGLFFLFSASAKVFIFGESPEPVTPVVTSVQPSATGAPGAPPVRQVPQQPTQPEPGSLDSEPFINELGQATGEGGIFSSENTVVPFYADFLKTTVSENKYFFGWLVIIGEAAVGFFLLLGLFTRLTAFIAMIMSTGYLLATMHLFPPVGMAANTAFLAMELAVLLSNAGKTAGMDALFGKKGKSEE
ncbi:MAG: DoxX family protein [Armatimonadota bacterium]